MIAALGTLLLITACTSNDVGTTSVVDSPTPLTQAVQPEPAQPPRETPPQSLPPALVSNACCVVCKKGKPCGDSCISINKQCRKEGGCACAG